jgi:hypothetical protein
MNAAELAPYDVLQISRDHGATWLDFSTLRSADDFALARRYVERPQDWACAEGAVAAGYQFRVWRPSGDAIVLSAEHYDADDE